MSALIKKLPETILLGFIWIYQRSLSALMGKQCRFYPTCSAYTAESVRRFGALKGSVLGFCRICRCHPWGGMGLDPVPEQFSFRNFRSKKTRPCDKTCGDTKQ